MHSFSRFSHVPFIFYYFYPEYTPDECGSYKHRNTGANGQIQIVFIQQISRRNMGEQFNKKCSIETNEQVGRYVGHGKHMQRDIFCNPSYIRINSERAYFQCFCSRYPIIFPQICKSQGKYKRGRMYTAGTAYLDIGLRQ